MLRFIVLRVAQGVVVIIGISIVVFSLIRLTGSPLFALLPQDATRQQITAMAKYLGINKPIVVQYFDWAGGVLHGNFGHSFFAGNASALPLVLDRVPATLLLASVALALAVVFGVAGGLLAAMRPGTWIDNMISSLSAGFQSMPTFWLGIMLIIIFAVKLEILPVAGSGSLRYLVLPAVTLAVSLIPQILRLTRARLSEVLHEDYIRAARAKGLSESKVIFRHALKNSGGAVITIVGTQFAYLMSGVVAVEAVFDWPGIGSLLISSADNADYAVLQATVFVIAVGTVIANLLTDVLVAAVDPRTRRGS